MRLDGGFLAGLIGAKLRAGAMGVLSPALSPGFAKREYLCSWKSFGLGQGKLAAKAWMCKGSSPPLVSRGGFQRIQTSRDARKSGFLLNSLAAGGVVPLLRGQACGAMREGGFAESLGVAGQT